MSRYIDADKLEADLLKHKAEANEAKMCLTENDFADLIHDADAADVEPVVHCAECKFFNRKEATTNGMCRCEVDKLWQSAFYRPYRRFGDFCSHGAKMDVEVNQ